VVFHSAGFLFVFLPLCLILYGIIPGSRGKNLLLALASLLFYACGGLAQVPVLLLSALWNYAFGLLLARGGERRKLWLALGVAGNLGLLCVCKYLNFFFGALGLPAPLPGLALPPGISFFTFHGVSYLADIHRGKGGAARRFGTAFLYLAFFPRLLAGPIVRWQDAEDQLAHHPAAAEDLSAGLRRFVRGMAKKLLLSEGAAAVANAVYALSPAALGSALAWCGALAYCLQIFFDFSGYSDMAIGLGRCFGFRFPENFNYPYVSGTVSEFWRRWHMTLNRWFVDYLYIPRGGSRRGKRITVRNKLIVFFFTGLWHGAGWTFILWGLWHGALVALEGLWEERLNAWRERTLPRVILHVYTLLAVMLGFVMFRAESPAQGFAMLGRMFAFASAGTAGRIAAGTILTPARIAALLAGILFSLPAAPALEKRAAARLGPAGTELAGDALALLGLFVCVLAMSAGGFSPFIYQQF